MGEVMQPPLQAGVVLQNRYRLLKLLGQGGFGRTYLAEDQGRFQEKCALKEYIPNQSSPYTLEKSRELFQREAAILYQIKHPQVPEFRATFEEDQRLFLVQQYIQGKTYRVLLDERISRGMAFSEPEVLWLLQRLIPVLAHIHSKGIIHRDITPDNIILCQETNLPVLIDFGVVKEVATQIQRPGSTSQPTTVGKPGYAPSEQVQTGRAYPSSDLYALAVTIVVLLTGHEPQELFDDAMLTWHWQQWVSVTPGFAGIINRMLSYRPGDRYPSVAELAEALRALYGMPPQQSQHRASSAAAPSASPSSPTSFRGQSPQQSSAASQSGRSPQNPPASSNPPPSRPNIAASEMRTVAAVGQRSPQSSQTSSSSPSRTTVGYSSSSSSSRSFWDNPLSVLALWTGVAVITAIGSWSLFSAVMNDSDSGPEPPPEVSEEPDNADAEPTPAPAEPREYSQQIQIPIGESVAYDGNLKENETINYIFAGDQGQQLAATLENEGVLMTLLGPDGQPLGQRSRRVSTWEGELPLAGSYTVQISPVQGLDESDYRLILQLNAAEPAPEPEPEPEPEPQPQPEPPPEPTIETERLTFSEGSDGLIVTANTNANTIRRYLVNARAGQVLSVEVLEGPVSLNIRYPDGSLVEDASRIVFWEAQLPTSGDYRIDVVAADATRFRLEVRVTGGQ